MSTIVTNTGICHYQTLGKGQPLLLLHGWLNSWDAWRECMSSITEQSHTRVYAIDFWGFGDSAANNNGHLESSTLDSYVELVLDVMDRLGIRRAPVAGHSMGGTVALLLALKYPERVSSVIVIGTPLLGGTLHPLLKLASHSWTAGLVSNFSPARAVYPAVVQLIQQVILARDSKRVRHMILRDMKRTTVQSFFNSISDLRLVDLRHELDHLSHPILGIYGENDNIVSPINAQILAERAGHITVEMVPDSRHFPMNDDPDRVVQSITSFLCDN